MKSRRNVQLLLAIVFLHGFVFYGPISTLYREFRGLSLSSLFLIESISWLTTLILEVPLGWFADRFGYKKTLLIGNFFYLLSKIIFYGANSFQDFLLERLALSLALAGLSGCDVALLHASTLDDERQKVFSQYHTISLLGFSLASLITTTLIHSPLDQVSIGRTGFLTIIPYLAAFILTFLLREVSTLRTERPRLLAGIKVAIKQPAIIVLVIAGALAREIYQTIAVFLNQAQYLRSGISVTWFGIILAVIQLFRLLAVQAYRLSDRFGLERAMALLLLIFPCSALVLYLTRNPIISVAGILLVSVALSFLEPLATTYQNDHLENNTRATSLSVFAMISEIVAMVINPIIGQAANSSIDRAFLFCTGIGLAGLAGYLLVLIKNRLKLKAAAD